MYIKRRFLIGIMLMSIVLLSSCTSNNSNGQSKTETKSETTQTNLSLPQYHLDYLLKSDGYDKNNLETTTESYPFAINEQRFVVGRDQNTIPSYWDDAGNIFNLPVTNPDRILQSNDTANSIDNNNVISSFLGDIWTALTVNPIYCTGTEGGLNPLRTIDSGIIVGNQYGSLKPAYLASPNDKAALLMKIPSGWLTGFIGNYPNNAGIQAIASNGACVGYVYTDKVAPAMYYWPSVTSEPIEVKFPDEVNFGAGDYYKIAGVNTKGEIIANLVKKNGENSSYYYANPQADPQKLSDTTDNKASNFITLAAINDNGSIIGNGVLGATLWLNRTPYSVTDLTDMPKTKDEHFTNPVCINNNGDIVVLYTGAYPIQCYAVISCKP